MMMYQTFIFPSDSYKVRLPTSEEKVHKRPKGKWISVLLQHFRLGLRVPLHPFINRMLMKYLKCGLGKIVLNSILQMTTFIAHCAERKKRPNSKLFLLTYRFGRSREGGLY